MQLRNVVLLIALFSFLQTSAQEITNLLLIGPDGITKNPKRATQAVIVKKYADRFERLDYKMYGPLSKSRSYKDSTLKVLHGKYYEYRTDGTLQFSGEYVENKKHGLWRTYSPEFKILSTVRYDNDVFVENLEEQKDSIQKLPDDREASFPGGVSAWGRYLGKALAESLAAKSNKKLSKVVVLFTIGSDGYMKEALLMKSENFALDEESMSIVMHSPAWTPAWQNGRAVKYYAIQPIQYNPAE